MKRGFFILACVLLISGCQTAPVPAEADKTVEVNLRPDPLKPVGENFTVPADWSVRLDRPDPDAIISANADSADIYFVSMVPGWHVTTGPASIYYHPQSTAKGNYEASLDVYLFDPGERREAFGMIFGGQNLDGPDQSYDYFVIRNSGEFLIKHRMGEETTVLQDWTANNAIVRYTDAAESSVLNKLTVIAQEHEVAFMINGVEVARLPRADVQTDGLVGFRVNHALNLHISNLQVVEG